MIKLALTRCKFQLQMFKSCRYKKPCFYFKNLRNRKCSYTKWHQVKLPTSQTNIFHIHTYICIFLYSSYASSSSLFYCNPAFVGVGVILYFPSLEPNQICFCYLSFYGSVSFRCLSIKCKEYLEKKIKCEASGTYKKSNPGAIDFSMEF